MKGYYGARKRAGNIERKHCEGTRPVSIKGQRWSGGKFRCVLRLRAKGARERFTWGIATCLVSRFIDVVQFAAFWLAALLVRTVRRNLAVDETSALVSAPKAAATPIVRAPFR